MASKIKVDVVSTTDESKEYNVIDVAKVSGTNITDIDGNIIVNSSGLVKTTTNQTIDGIKTYTSSLITPTPTLGDNSTKVATTEFVQNAIAGINTGAYGVSWNQNIDSYILEGASDRTQIQSNMKRCILNTNGTVNYYLDQYDSTKKADGSASDLTGASGNVMVEIPKFWYKHEKNGDIHTWMVSPTADDGYTVHPAFIVNGIEKDYRYYRAYEGYNNGGILISRSGVTPTRSQTIGTFRTQARANGTGWHLTDYNLLFAVQLLFLTEYGTFDSQSILGNGNDTGNDYGITTGQSNSIGNASSGSSNDNMWMSYRGIENFYADIWEWIDGINIQNYLIYLNDNPDTFASDVFTGDYVNTGVYFLSGASNTFIKELANSNQGFFPSASGGTSSTYLTDAFWSATGNKVLAFGGNANYGLSDGAFYLLAKTASSYSEVSVGAGVAF